MSSNTAPLIFIENEALAAWSGQDVAKDSFVASLYLPHRPSAPPRSPADLPTRQFPRTRIGVQQWLAWCDEQLARFARRKGLDQPPPLRACMEATGRYSKELKAWIDKERPAVSPHIADPLAASFYARSLRMRNKTDKVDAAVLSRMGYERRPRPSEDLPPALETLRAMTRQRDYLMNQFKSATLRAGELDAFPDMLRIQQTLVRQLARAIKQVDRRIARHLQAQPELKAAVRRLQTIPGVGRLTAVIALSELGDLRRFNTSRQVASFAGLNPKLFESGSSVHYQTRLSKQGPSRVRKALYMSAMGVLRTQSTLRRFYDHLLAGGKSKMAALGAVMRKQIVLMRALLISGQDYDPNFVKTGHAANNNPGPCG